MSLIYKQRNAQGDGELWLDGEFEGVAYSGRDRGRNAPDMEAVKGVGPIPRGRYRISLCHEEEHPNLAMPVLRLTPDGQDAHGRSGFLIHGDNVNHDASHGCIIVGRSVRQRIAGDRETELVVE